MCVSIIGGALVWALSPTVTGEIEPWDSSMQYYAFGIFIAAATGALLSGWHVWVPIVGVYLAQNIYTLFFYSPGGPIILPMFISAAIYGFVPSIFGATIGSLPYVIWQKMNYKPSPKTRDNK